MSPLVSQLLHEGLMSAVSYNQVDTFKAGTMFCQAEGILPAPETNHAIAAAIDEALKCKESGESKTIAFNLSGHGHFDVQAYLDYHAGELVAYDYPEEDVAEALAGLPKVE
jgi:tryptophan synthase beta chain